MVRVPRNKGSYAVRKGGSYQVKYPLGWNEEAKKYDEYREDVESEAEAIALIKSINDFVYHGGSPASVPAWRLGNKAKDEGSAVSVSEFAEEFISFRQKQKKVEERTIQSDRECFARISPYIGDKAIDAVTPRDIDGAYAHMRSDGSDNLAGRPYSGTTLQKTHAFLSMLFDKAIDYGYIPDSPMAKIERPKRDTPEKVALSAEQAQALFNEIVKGPLEAKPVGVLLCLCCGLRESEMLALRWSDYSSGEIEVSKSLRREKQAFKSTKNGEERTVPCPPPLIGVLESWKSQQREWYASMGLAWSEASPIVNNRVGTHTLQRTFCKWFKSVRAKYPIPDDFTTHGLRHTYVTLLSRDCGIDPRTTRSMSGHKTEQAFSIYTHTSGEWRQKAAIELGNVIAPDDGAMRCCNCRLWSPSPNDGTKGACWGSDGGLIETSANELCVSGAFLSRPSSSGR